MKNEPGLSNLNKMSDKLKPVDPDGFRTVVVPGTLKPPVNHIDKLLLIGSCFTEHIGTRLQEYKFRVDLNPFGIVYNPASIAAQLERLLEPVPYEQDSLVNYMDLWHSPDHHGRFSHPSHETCIAMINSRLKESSEWIREAKYIVITFGSARAWFIKENGRLVANCHQMPGEMFTSRVLAVDEIAELFGRVFNKLVNLNPAIRFIMNVSPVRYWKYGHFDNQVSKSTLILAIRELQERFNQVFYFPSYEIFMDDLRDYRFYEPDLLHPGSAGVDYVWEKFCAACIDRKTRLLMIEIGTVLRACKHRSKGFMTPSHQKFLRANLEKVSLLQNRYPDLDFSAEIRHFSQGLP